MRLVLFIHVISIINKQFSQDYSVIHIYVAYAFLPIDPIFDMYELGSINIVLCLVLEKYFKKIKYIYIFNRIIFNIGTL